jgi:1-deoxy-D-xylulose-5-phosphate reductoisomerase
MIEDVMQTIGRRDIATLDDVLAVDGMAREAAQEWLTCLA